MGKRIVAAIDIGSFKISTVITAIDEVEKVPQVIGVCTQPSMGVKRGVIINIDEATSCVANSLNAAERMAGVTIPSAYVTINGKDLQSMNNKGVVAISRPQGVGPDDLLRSIESAKTIPLPQDRDIIHVISREFIVDSQGGIKYPIGMSGTRLEVDTHIVTFPVTTIQNIMKVIQNTGLEVDGMVYTGLASSYSVLTKTEKELGVLLLDIGAGTVSISMFIEEAIAYSGVIPIGSMHITSDLAAGLQMSFEEAERLKRAFGDLVKKSELFDKPEVPEEAGKGTALERKQKESEDKKTKSKKKTSDTLDVSGIGITSASTVSKSLCMDIVSARIDEILDLVKGQITQSRVPFTIPAGVVITGGGAKMYGISDQVKKSFGVTSRIGKPSGLKGMTDEISDPEFSAVQGLIRYAVEEDVDISGGKSFGGNAAAGLFDKVKGWVSNFLPKG